MQLFINEKKRNLNRKKKKKKKKQSKEGCAGYLPHHYLIGLQVIMKHLSNPSQHADCDQQPNTLGVVLSLQPNSPDPSLKPLKKWQRSLLSQIREAQ